MKKLILFFLISILTSCVGRISNTDTKLDDGHDYTWIYTTKAYLQHSPECKKCKRMRQGEIQQYVDSVLNENKL